MTTEELAAAAPPPSTPPAPAQPEEAPPLSPFAGFWRRFAALFVDSLLLGLVGQLLGLLFFDGLVALGSWGRLIGFAVAWPYLGLMSSRIGGGRTLGKRLLGLRVVRLDGHPLSPARGLVRAAVLCAPWFLNGAVADPAWLAVLPLVVALTLVVFGVGIGSIYLVIFNRPSRRALHDWIAGSVVVREPGLPGLSLAAASWGGHRVVLGLLGLACLTLPVWLSRQTTTFGPLLAMQATVAGQAGVRQAGIWWGTSWVKSASQGSTSQTQLVATTFVSRSDLDAAALADRVGQALLAGHAEASQVDVLGVVVVRGFDIGIASRAQSYRFGYSPAKWRERLGQ